jgi:putative two-component system hydrogenase maturation factor HypX/HoxX
LRILLVAHSFNSLTQRTWCELADRGHDVSLELDITDDVTREAVRLHAPELVVAPYLRRAIPEDVWRRVPCLIVHPGIPGDRGPAALDWAILECRTTWGVTVLEANAEYDAGDVWGASGFAMRPAAKGSLYRDEVANAAVAALLAALDRRARGEPPQPQSALDPATAGTWHSQPTRAERAIDWAADGTDDVLRKLRASDSTPGTPDEILGRPYRLYDAHAGPAVSGATPGQWLGRRGAALLRATRDGSVWIGHAKRDASGSPAAPDAPAAFKLPVLLACPEAASLPERPLPNGRPFLVLPMNAGDPGTATGRTGTSDAGRDPTLAPDGEYADLRYAEEGDVGYLAFDFYNGAMGVAQCERLCAALDFAAARPTRVLVLLGGRDFWSNGVHLNVIEAADSAADESWRNIQAIDDVAERILRMDSKLTVAALRGNAGAGGAFLALAADRVWVRPGIVLNFHYRNMGNLYGSEFWTYTLPRRIGAAEAQRLIDQRPPLLGRQAVADRLADAAFGADADSFVAEARARAAALASAHDHAAQLAGKRARRASDESAKPLSKYREEELARMRRSFYGFDTSYHVARHRFVHKAPHSWTPRHLAKHRA